MHVDKINFKDIDQVANLQPDGWSDIAAEFRFFLSKEFCNPIKIVVDNKIVGVGTSIVFKNTAWLGHIIVGIKNRNRGFGSLLVDSLLNNLKSQSIDTISLIASPFGEPVYIKFGFRIVSEYIYLKRERPWIEKIISDKIVPYKSLFYPEIMRLDKEIAGEDREQLLKEHLKNSFVYIDDEEIKGFYLTTLGEGQIFANTTEAGIELMSLKYAKIDNAVIPEQNQIGLAFLRNNGFGLSETKGNRMLLGKEINWQPRKFFSRIGGDYG